MFLENATAAPFIHAAARLPTSVHPLGLRAPVRRRRSSGRRPGRRRQRRLRHADPCAGRALEPARRIQHARWGFPPITIKPNQHVGTDLLTLVHLCPRALDFNFNYSTLCLNMLRQARICQNWLCYSATWLNSKSKSKQMGVGHPVYVLLCVCRQRQQDEQRS